MRKTIMAVALAALALAVPATAEQARRAPPATFEEFQARREERFKKRLAKASPEQQARMKERWARRQQKLASMTPEQKAKMKERFERRKARFARMSPEERKALRAKRKEQRARFKAMSPEERRAARKAWRAGHGKRGAWGKRRPEWRDAGPAALVDPRREERLRTIEASLSPSQVERFRQERERLLSKLRK